MEPKKPFDFQKWKIFLFAGALLLLFTVGLLFFLRPATSESEKRELTKFPTPTGETLAFGEFFEGVSTWYADTFPGREALVSGSLAMKSLRGIQDEVIIRPSDPTPTPNPDGETTDSEDTTPIERLGGVYLKGKTAYEIYGESREQSAEYAALISKAAAQLSGKATVYDLIVPLSSNVNLSAAEQASIGCSDADAAIDRMFSAMQGVKTVEVLDLLKSHKNEYLYFRTDHHWTALGAYYSYTAFCKAAGISPKSLSDWQKYEFQGFLGTLYNEAGKPSVLTNNPDTVEAWVPNGTNDIYITDKNGERSRYRSGVVRVDTDKFYAAAGSKYNCFIMGDNPLSEIHNETLHDGSSIIVVKESFGNAFVPFLVDHYEYVYVVDYRYFTPTTGKTLSQFVAETGAKNVLFINNLTATSSPSRIGELERLLK
ncbi:MAG: hypothetical protein IJR88_06155 [Clostridia bacterium]|nr:hypothetical protein [Clostridia bacterium]